MALLDKKLPPNADFSQGLPQGIFRKPFPKVFCISKRLLDVLACPKCKGSLNYEKGKSRLVCRKCRLAYRVEDGIPIMLVEEAEKLK